MAEEEQNNKKRSGGIQYTEEFAALLASNVAKKPKKAKECVSIGIIGPSSKRNTDFEANSTRILSASLFDAMVAYTIDWIETSFLQKPETPLDWSQIRLVSGGASWCDHVAVRIYIKKHCVGAKLTLFLPCPMTKSGYFDSGKTCGAITNPGRICNKQHADFTKVIVKSSLADVLEAIKLGATVDTDHSGFFACGKALAHACDDLLAFGWSDKGKPDTPGTTRTWNAAPSHVKRHYCSLDTLVTLTE